VSFAGAVVWLLLKGTLAILFSLLYVIREIKGQCLEYGNYCL